MNTKKDERTCMTSKERQTTETVQAKKDKQQKHKSWLLRLVEKIGTEELGPSSPPPMYRRTGGQSTLSCRERKGEGGREGGSLCEERKKRIQSKTVALALQTMASSTTNEKAEEGIKARLGKDSKEGGTEGGKRIGREED
jgi:hypothetical protein